MSKVDHSKLKAIGDSKSAIGPRALDSKLLELAKSYKKNVAKRYRLINAEEIKAKIFDDELPAIVEYYQNLNVYVINLVFVLCKFMFSKSPYYEKTTLYTSVMFLLFCNCSKCFLWCR